PLLGRGDAVGAGAGGNSFSLEQEPGVCRGGRLWGDRFVSRRFCCAARNGGHADGAARVVLVHSGMIGAGATRRLSWREGCAGGGESAPSEAVGVRGGSPRLARDRRAGGGGAK